MNHCAILRHHLVKHGRELVENHPRLRAHTNACADCRRLLHSWQRIPALLNELPGHEPDDLLLRRTRKAIAGAAGNHRPAPHRAPRMAASLASAAIVLAAIGISRQLVDRELPLTPPAAFKEEYELASSPPPPAAPRTLELDNFETMAGRSDQRADKQQLADEDGRTNGAYAPTEPALADRLESTGSRDASVLAGLPEEEHQPVSRRSEKTNQSGTAGLETGAKDEGFQLDARQRQFRGQLSLNEPVSGDPADDERRQANRHQAQGKLDEDKKAKVRVTTSSESLAAKQAGKLVGGAADFGFDYHVDQLQFQAAEGYWSNTHVPGDPAIRLLKARLAQWDRSGSPLLSGLEQEVQPLRQPFDAPADNALALSLMSDVNAVDGATRMRLQVGVRGIEHRRGQRPAMNLGLVIDLPADADDDTRIAARALLDAVLASKQPGDRFSLVLNGAIDHIIEPDDFRFGPLELAREAIAGIPSLALMRHIDLTLSEAIGKATEMVRQTDDPSLPIGSSSILLVSAGSLDDLGQLTAQVHAQAVEGITTSVVPLGPRPDNTDVEQLVLAGLGNRRVLDAPDKARQLVETELHASSRAVARAARLSIRLAPGVKLLDVIGSERLDEQRSQRVRDIENSMDARLSRNLGIEADRGEDEGGIQIVIPSIFSGDDVSVLLDVVASQPGDIASVSLRYKDLVYLRNGKLSGQLSLPAGAPERGPEQHAVMKSLMAHHFSAAAGYAADAIGRGQPGEAAAILSRMDNEITGMRERVPAFANDPDLQRDQQILERYIHVLANPGTYQPELADSLRYAAWAKTHRPPAEWK